MANLKARGIWRNNGPDAKKNSVKSGADSSTLETIDYIFVSAKENFNAAAQEIRKYGS